MNAQMLAKNFIVDADVVTVVILFPNCIVAATSSETVEDAAEVELNQER